MGGERRGGGGKEVSAVYNRALIISANSMVIAGYKTRRACGCKLPMTAAAIPPSLPPSLHPSTSSKLNNSNNNNNNENNKKQKKNYT